MSRSDCTCGVRRVVLAAMAIAFLAHPVAGRTLDPRRRMEVGSRSLLGAPRERLSLRATLATREEVAAEADDVPPRPSSGTPTEPDEDYEMPEIMTFDKEHPQEEDTLDDSVTAPAAPADGVILTKLPPVRKVRTESDATASTIPETTRSAVDRAAEAGEDAAETAATTSESTGPAPASAPASTPTLLNATSNRTSERAPVPINGVGTSTANETEAKKALAESLLKGVDAANGGDVDHDNDAPAPSEAPTEAHAASKRMESENVTEADIVGVSEAPANATVTTSTKSSNPASDSDYAYFDPASGSGAVTPPEVPPATEWDDVDESDTNAVDAASATRDDDRDAFSDDDLSDRADAVPEANRPADVEPAEKSAKNAADARSPEIDGDIATVDAATSMGTRTSSSRSFEPRASSPREDDIDARLGVVAEESSVDVAGAEARFGAFAQAALGGAIVGLVGLVAYCRRGVSTAWTSPFTVTDATASKGGRGRSAASRRKGSDDWNDWSDDGGWGSDGGGGEVSRRPAASASEWTAKEPAWSDEERGGGGESEETDGWDGSNEDAAAMRVKERND